MVCASGGRGGRRLNEAPWWGVSPTTCGQVGCAALNAEFRLSHYQISKLCQDNGGQPMDFGAENLIISARTLLVGMAQPDVQA